MSTLTEDRQELRDAIWMHGPEHFDVEELVTIDDLYVADCIGAVDSITNGSAKRWTACFVGHRGVLHGSIFFMKGIYRERGTRELLGDDFTSDYTCVAGWHFVNIDGWNPGDNYDTLIAEGDTDQVAQWRTAVEWLDLLVKRGDQ